MSTRARPFADFLHQHRQGRFHEELTDELNHLISQIRLCNKGGTLTVQIKVDPLQGDASMVVITDKITNKPPQIVDPAMYYTTLEGNLSRQNPHQTDIEDLRVVKDADKVMEVDPETGEVLRDSEVTHG